MDGKRILFFAAFCLAAALLSPALLAAESTAAPCLAVHPPVWDLGAITPGRPSESSLIINNTGRADLVISSVSVSCGCLTAAPAGRTIPPGSATDLAVSFDAWGREGEIREYIVIRSNDPLRPVLRLRVTGRVLAEAPPVPARPPGASAQALEPASGPGAGEGAGQEPEPSPAPKPAAGGAALARPVTVLFFYSTFCPKCFHTRDVFLPHLRRKLGENLKIEEYDLVSDRDYAVFLDIGQRLGREIDYAPPIAVVGRTVLQGAEVEERLEAVILAEAAGGDPPEPTPEPEGLGSGGEGGPGKGAVERFRGLGLLAVVLGGLVDGVNPCAFATLVFLLSYLALAGGERKRLLIAGLAFALGVFLAYFLVGLGLLALVGGVGAFVAAGRILKWAAAGVAALLGLLSLHDYWRIRRGEIDRVSLQLSERVKLLIHKVIRERLGGRAAGWTGFAAGFLVALLEFPCTGQVYFPIVVVLREIAPLRLLALSYLLLYNLLFILPLLILLGLAYWGASSARLAAAARRHLGLAKLGLAGLFLGLAALLIVL